MLWWQHAGLLDLMFQKQPCIPTHRKGCRTCYHVVKNYRTWKPFSSMSFARWSKVREPLFLQDFCNLRLHKELLWSWEAACVSVRSVSRAMKTRWIRKLLKGFIKFQKPHQPLIGCFSDPVEVKAASQSQKDATKQRKKGWQVFSNIQNSSKKIISWGPSCFGCGSFHMFPWCPEVLQSFRRQAGA